MKKISIYFLLFAFCIIKLDAQNIRLLNRHPRDAGKLLHNGAFGSVFNIGRDAAKIDYMQAQNLVESFKLMRTPKLIVDTRGLSNGNPTKNGITWNNSLLFGGEGTGELISSKRNAGHGRWGLDFATYWRNRMHIGNDGSVGVGTTNGLSPSATIEGRFNIHNFNSGENNFYKSTNLYTSARYDGNSDRVGITNHIWDTNRGSSMTINAFYSDMSSLYGAYNVTPNNTIGINNNMQKYTAPSLINNPSVYNYSYGIFNDLNDKKIAGYESCVFGQPCYFLYQPRVGILNVTNTENGNVDGVSYGSGKIGVWSVNIGGYSGGSTANSSNLYDGWAQWNDGNTFLRNGYITASDKKLKTKITSLNKKKILSKIQLLKPVKYELKKRKGIVENGFLAQDLKEVFPEIVVKSLNPVTKEEVLGVNYQQLHSLQIAAIQAQQKLIERLEKKIATLEKLIKRKRR